jgi:hypothetical protein
LLDDHGDPMEFLLDDFNEVEDAFEDLIGDIVVNLKANVDVLQGMISCSRSGPKGVYPQGLVKIIFLRTHSTLSKIFAQDFV